MAQLELHKPQLEEASLQVIAIAMGELKHLERYCGKLAPGITCLTGNDHSEQAYYTYGLQEGSWNQLASIDVLKAGARAFRQGHRPGERAGNTRMLPGTFIVDGNGRIAFAYYSKHAGDHPDIELVLNAAYQLPATSIGKLQR